MLTLEMDTRGVASKSFAAAKSLLSCFLFLAVMWQVPHLEASELPVLSIAAKTESVEEGEIAKFVITASTPPSEVLLINLTADGDDWNVKLNPKHTIKMLPDSDVIVFFLATNDDLVDKTRGDLKVELLPSNQYTVMESESLAVVSIKNSYQ